MQHVFLNILSQVAKGEKTPESALHELGQAPFASMVQGLNLDYHRELRTGLGEVIFAERKNLPDLLAAIENLKNRHQSQKTVSPQASRILVTRILPNQISALTDNFPESECWADARLFAIGQRLDLNPPWQTKGDVIIVTAGASDLPVALEALGSARFFGLNTGLVTDVGVAGIHRLAPHLEHLSRAKLVIAIAGMEGALPSVLAGLLPCPVLGVPTSVGYGVSAGGYAALMGMLASCAPGLSVMNIDNGFGAAAFAAKLLNNLYHE